MAKTTTTPTDSKNDFLELSPIGILKTMLLIIGVLLFFQVLIALSESLDYHNKVTSYIRHFFNFHSENNFPAYISSLFLVLAGLLSLLLGFHPDVSKAKHRRKWKVLGGLFFFLGFDEAIQIHEVVSQGLRNNLGEQLPGFLHYAWVIPYALLVVMAVLYFFNFIWNLPTKLRNLIFLAGFVYVFGALGLEMVESYIDANVGTDNLLYIILVTIEETMEMLGIAIICYALSLHLASLRTRIRFGSKGSKPGAKIW